MNKADYAEYTDRMQKTLDVMQQNFAAVRAGRANAAVLDQIRVDYYGTPTPINQIGNISSPEPRLLVIAPWEAKMIPNIEKAIQKSDLGLRGKIGGAIAVYSHQGGSLAYNQMVDFLLNNGMLVCGSNPLPIVRALNSPQYLEDRSGMKGVRSLVGNMASALMRINGYERFTGISCRIRLSRTLRPRL